MAWLLSARRKRSARKGERYVLDYEFPPHIERRVRKRLPQLDDAGWALAERGLREWFVCCAWRGRTVLAMPSRAVDEAWHEFLLDSVSYTAFCQAAFGDYLHHTPDEAASAPSPGDPVGDTVRAWDRSGLAGSVTDSVLWNLDEQLGIERPLGFSAQAVEAARRRSRSSSDHGWVCVVPVSAAVSGDGGGHHGGHGGHGGGESGGEGRSSCSGGNSCNGGSSCSGGGGCSGGS